MTLSSLAVLDASDFPIVRLSAERVSAPGSASGWCRDMDVLVGRAEPFVLIYPGRPGEESHDDRVARGLWLKRNKGPLADSCLALITVEPDEDRRADLEAMFPNLEKAFGVRQAACATDDLALALAQTFLAGGSVRAG